MRSPLTLLLISACAVSITAHSASTELLLSDLEVLDCLLPGEVRSVGGRTYLSSRRPTGTTVAECRVRGGEYVAYDRANLETSLKVWMEAAQQGNAEAQITVVEIHERGLGTEPNIQIRVLSCIASSTDCKCNDVLG